MQFYGRFISYAIKEYRMLIYDKGKLRYHLCSFSNISHETHFDAQRKGEKLTNSLQEIDEDVEDDSDAN